VVVNMYRASHYISMNMARCMIIHDPVVIAVAEVRLRAVTESAPCYAANDGSLLPVLPTLQYSGATISRLL